MKEKLFDAVNTSDIRNVRKLIRMGVDVNFVHGSYTPLLIAIERKNFKIIKLLISAGADVNMTCQSHEHPLIEAIRWYNGIIYTLIEAGANVNAEDKDGVPAWIVAMEYDDFRTCQLLLRAGADMDYDVTYTFKKNSLLQAFINI